MKEFQASVPVNALDLVQEGSCTVLDPSALRSHVSDLVSFDQVLHIHTARHVCSHNTMKLTYSAHVHAHLCEQEAAPQEPQVEV